MKRPHLHVIIVLSLLALLVGAYAGWYLIVERAAARALMLSQEIDQTAAVVAVAVESRDAFSTITADEAAINSYFTVIADIALFLEELEVTGRGLGSDVDVISVSDKPTGEGRIALSLRIRGAYDAVVRTIGVIEYGPHDTRLENLTLDVASEGESKEWVATASFSIGTATTTAAK